MSVQKKTGAGEEGRLWTDRLFAFFNWISQSFVPVTDFSHWNNLITSSPCQSHFQWSGSSFSSYRFSYERNKAISYGRKKTLSDIQGCEGHNTEYYTTLAKVKDSTWPVSLGPYDNKASESQQTITAWKMDWRGKIFGLFQSNSLPIHRYPENEPHWPSDGKLGNSHRSKKITLTHLLLIALSHPCER